VGVRNLRALILVAGLASRSLAQHSPPSAEWTLHSLGFEEGEISRARHGEPVARLVPAPLDRDVIVAGAVLLDVPRDAYLAHAIEPGRLIAPGATRSRVIAGQPTDADVRDIAFDGSEYRAVRDCEPGDCKFKLPASLMRAFATDVDWKSPTAKEHADTMLRRNLFNLLTDYRARGNAGLPEFDDGHHTRGADAFAGLIGQVETLYEYAPDMRRYLVELPAQKPHATTEMLYWAENRFPRLRPTFTLNELIAYVPDSGAAVVAQKILYANHYFESALETMAIVPASHTTTWLISVRRMRFDYLPRGIFNIRGRVRNALIDLTRTDLSRERDIVLGKK
jgi:antitoxin (DNA-binding transcriptional repressor) of toxin-antitoxin stability system